MAVTLLQAARDQRMGMSQKEGALIQLFDYVSPIINTAPAVPIDDFFDEYEQVQTMPTVGWRGFNEAFAESSGTTVMRREFTKIIGGEVKIDVEFLNGPKGARTKRVQTELKVLAAKNELERAIFEGSESNSIKEMVGLRDRIDSTQLILMGSGGATMTLAKLRDLRDAVPFSTTLKPGYKRGEGIRVVMYMNGFLRNKMDDLINASTGSRQIITTKNEFGDTVDMWQGAEIVVPRKSGESITSTGQLLWFDEDPGDGTADCASIYIVVWGEDHTRLIYRRPSNEGKMLRVFEVPQMESEPRYMMRFSGMFGFQAQHPLCIARLYGITQT